MSKQKSSELAVAVAHVETLDKTVNTFAATLTAEQQKLVRTEVAAILGAMEQVVKARIVIGESLIRLHDALKTESFNKFCQTVGKKLGIAPATAYRWIGGFKMVHGNLGTAAPIILRLTDGGNKITTTDDKSGAVIFTPEAKIALDKMKAAPLPSNPTPEQSEQWGRTFVGLVEKEGHSGSKDKSERTIAIEKIDKLWDLFGEICVGIKGKDNKVSPSRIDRVKGAKERREVLDHLADTLSGMQTEYTRQRKTVDAVPATKEKTPKVAAKKDSAPSNVSAA